MSNRAHLKLAGESNCGLVRERNEDSFCYADYAGDNAVLAVVADGIGGHRDGDIASFVCSSHLLTAWKRRAIRELTVEGARDFLVDTLTEINRTLFHRNRRERNRQPMGTTVVAAIFLPESLVVAHAGDSRLYSYDAATGLQQLTEDHTLIAKLKASGSNFSLDNTNFANIISRAIGPRPKPELEVQMLPRGKATRYLLCSDGLSRYADGTKLEAIVAGAQTPQEALNILMRTALIEGGRDNISIICAFPAAGDAS